MNSSSSCQSLHRPSALIGITQRLAFDAEKKEARDALAKNWATFFAALGVLWVPLPNAGEHTVELAKRAGLTGLVLSGGEDVGVHPERDMTEDCLLQWARHEEIPVIGICRGFQFIQQWLGGNLVAVDKGRHVGSRHPVFTQNILKEVNSFHSWGIRHLASPLQALAVDKEDESVEAACGGVFLGLMWHPERYAIPHPEDLALFTSHFRLPKKVC